MNDFTDLDFLDRIQSILPQLHPAERRLGEFLSNFPGELASYDAQELAQLADVSKATVSRFVRKIGYSNYEAARKHAREESKSGSRLYLAHADANEAAGSLDPKMLEAKSNLDRTFGEIEQTELDQIAASIIGARKLWIIGQRISHSFATYLYWQLTKIVEDIAVAPGAGETLGEHIASMRPDDCVVCFALRRRINGTNRMIDEIKSIGTPVVLITDEGMRKRDDIDWHLHCHTQTSSPQFEHTSVIALCHQLVIRATFLADSHARERLRKIEEINERLSSFSQREDG